MSAQWIDDAAIPLPERRQVDSQGDPTIGLIDFLETGGGSLLQALKKNYCLIL